MQKMSLAEFSEKVRKLKGIVPDSGTKTIVRLIPDEEHAVKNEWNSCFGIMRFVDDFNHIKYSPSTEYYFNFLREDNHTLIEENKAYKLSELTIKLRPHSAMEWETNIDREEYYTMRNPKFETYKREWNSETNTPIYTKTTDYELNNLRIELILRNSVLQMDFFNDSENHNLQLKISDNEKYVYVDFMGSKPETELEYISIEI